MSVIIAIDKNSGYAGQILTNMSENDDLRDLKLIAAIDKQKFSVHRLVMMSSSKYFAALLGPNFKEGQEQEVSIADIDGATLKLIIDFCYTGELRITDDNIMQVIAAASAMELVLIEEKCQQFWNDILEISNCVEMFSLADRYSFVLLRKRALDMICEYFEKVPIADLQALTFPCFSELIKCDQIHAVWQEEFIFQRMALWVDYDEVNRAIHAPELFQSIRLEILSKNFLLDVGETFAKKYGCLALLVSEYRRRIENDGKPAQAYNRLSAASQRIYSTSGKDGVFTIQKYNPISDRWEYVQQLKDNTFKGRERIGQIFAENKLFLIGGKKGKGYVRTVDSYVLDLTMEKQEKKKVVWARSSFQPILLNNHIYIFGGWTGSVLRTCERLTMTTMQTKKLQPMQFGRMNYAAATWDGKIYVAGGQTSKSSILCSVECYDPIENEWTKLSNMNHPRTSFALVESKGVLYAMGHHKTIERYDPVQNRWTVIGEVDMGETIKQAINMRNEIYVQMKGAKFGKFKVEPECSLVQLQRLNSGRSQLQRINNGKSVKPLLFIN